MNKTVLQVKEEAQAQPTGRKSSRLYFADNLRAALVILVVLHHIALVYGAGAPFYYVEPPFEDPTAFKTLLIFVLFNQAWFMGAFFLLAGYFTPGSYDRKGAGTFLSERLVRLGIPLLIFLFLLNPISELGGYLMPATLTGVTDPPTWDMYPSFIGLGPLWFVAMLLIFSFVYAGWRILTGSRKSSPEKSASSPGYLLIGGFALALALISYLWRILVPLGQSVNLFTDALSFPTIAYLPQYLSFFIVGLVASRRDWLRTLSPAMGVMGISAAVAAGVLLFPLAFSGSLLSLELTPALDNAMGNGHWQSAAYVLWDSVFAVGIALGLIVLFRRFFNEQVRFGAFLSRHSYAVYVLHIPIIIYLAYTLSEVDLATLVKFGVASLIIVPSCFVVAYVVRKAPFASRVF